MAQGRRPGFGTTISQGFKPPAKRRAAAAGPRGRKPARAGARGRAGKGSVNGARPAVGEPALLKQREELANRFAQLQWDLGGMTYEMASRDHYRLDVLNKHAAELQRVDAELGQVEHLLKLDEAGAASTCPACGALQARGAVFCWQCGTEIKAPTTPEAKPAAASRAEDAPKQ